MVVLSQSAVVPQSSQSKFFGCLAQCGIEFGHEKTETLVSGVNSTSLVVEEADLEKCMKICRTAGESPKNESGFAYDSRDGFDDIELTCVNKLTLFPPRVQAKFDLQSHESSLLRVIEVWRTFAFKDGHLNNSLVSRKYTFSSRFEVDYEYSNVQEKEFLTVRAFSFDQNGLARRPQCSGEITPESLFNSRRDVLQLKLVDFSANKSVALIEWNGYDSRYPAECEHFVSWSSGSESMIEMIEFDSSHRFAVPLRSDPKTRTHVITVYSKSESAFSDRRQSVLNIDLDNNHLVKAASSRRGVPFNWEILIVIGVAIVISIIFLCVLSKMREEQRIQREKMEKRKIPPIHNVYEKDSDVIAEMLTPIRHKDRLNYHYDNTVDSPILPDFSEASSPSLPFQTRILPFQMDATNLTWTKSAPCQFQV
ncbi:unnamed protein product [Bursaphelenchus xylophilus]|uniref:(pine wood nematode) hypothetical protein n=1 Tax=Bursaphelenchus xylophilus TaxID=6326 RepID=A0A1I7RLN3_BURXY|nr:unnamed protein product [Bursaphelenchus xylophilus]CAG9082784.1 unnamed protein product [Bursaphelenchus xylophilus]